jgi:hypothetical protein
MIPAAFVEQIISALTEQLVLSDPAVHLVVPGAAVQAILAGIAPQR